MSLGVLTVVVIVLVLVAGADAADGACSPAKATFLWHLLAGDRAVPVDGAGVRGQCCMYYDLPTSFSQTGHFFEVLCSLTPTTMCPWAPA
ncbi:hypothetical protein EDD21DRAFT_30148 [Dissophora ornata]|nr:hypothetical protein EDD21DRAFT_30148 [Dissophora ornata]